MLHSHAYKVPAMLAAFALALLGAFAFTGTIAHSAPVPAATASGPIGIHP
jgi:hypothetical protein